MGSSREKALQEAIKEAVDWYRSNYENKIEVHERYDRQEKHWSWRIVIQYRNDEWVLPFGISEATLTGPNFFKIRSKLKQFIINSMKRAQRKYQPIWIGTPFGPEKVE